VGHRRVGSRDGWGGSGSGDRSGQRPSAVGWRVRVVGTGLFRVCSIGLSPITFIGWEWADRRYLLSAHSSRWELPIFQWILVKPMEVIEADRKISFSYSETGGARLDST
jgi:hypothetical protein